MTLKIDYKLGEYHGTCAWSERHLFRDAGFYYSNKKKVWVTTRAEYAEKLEGAEWSQAALDHQGGLAWLARTTAQMSYSDTTDFKPPVPDALHPRTGLPFAYLGYQAAGVEMTLRHFDRGQPDVLIADAPGLGKQQSIETPVYTPKGWVKMGTLKVGDFVYSIDGKPTKVTGVFPQGIKPNYEIAFRDGTKTNCGLEHLWFASHLDNASRRRKIGKPEYAVYSLEQMLEKPLFRPQKNNRKGARWYIPLCDPVQHDPVNLTIDPYILGVLLGDGCIVPGAFRLSASTKSIEIVHEVEKRLPQGINLRKYQHPTDSKCCPYYTFIGESSKEWASILDRFNLRTTSHFKFIPESYKRGSIEQRLDILRGLMDTDGSCKNNRTTFHTVSKYLADDVCEIVRSLGGMAVQRWYDRTHEGKTRECQVNVKMPLCPFYIKYKVKEWRPNQHLRKYVRSIEKIDDVEQVCIQVENSTHLYLVENFIVTHNTIQAVGLSNCLPGRKILVIAPASLKVNWLREWGMWGTQGLTVGIAEVSHKYKVQEGFYKNGKPKIVTKIMPEFWPDTDVVIVNAEILNRFETQIKEGTEWDLLIVDEAHSLKSDESNRTLFILGGTRKEKIEGTRKKVWRKYRPIKTKNRLFLTGTPILNRPVELWPIVKAFDRKGLGHSWEAYVYRYCAAWFDQYRGKFGALDVSGASNKEELGQKLRAAFMIRRLKKDVLKDLPPKSRNIVLVDSSEIRELVAREDELALALKLYETDILGNITDAKKAEMIVERAALYGFGSDAEDGPKFKDLDLDWASGVLGLEPPMIEALFNEITAVRRDLGLAKLSASIPWVRDFLDGEEKLVLFAYHTDVILAMKEALADYNPAVIYGATAVKKRQLEVDRFQNDETCRVIILNILAGGVGHTLTRASDVAFLEGDWVPSNLLQAEDRVHRIGQTADRIRVYYLLADGSLDARIAQSSKMKEDNISAILDT